MSSIKTAFTFPSAPTISAQMARRVRRGAFRDAEQLSAGSTASMCICSSQAQAAASHYPSVLAWPESRRAPPAARMQDPDHQADACQLSEASQLGHTPSAAAPVSCYASVSVTPTSAFQRAAELRALEPMDVPSGEHAKDIVPPLLFSKEGNLQPG